MQLIRKMPSHAKQTGTLLVAEVKQPIALRVPAKLPRMHRPMRLEAAA